MDHEAEEVLNELNLLTESEADTGGQGDDYPVGEFFTIHLAGECNNYLALIR